MVWPGRRELMSLYTVTVYDGSVYDRSHGRESLRLHGSAVLEAGGTEPRRRNANGHTAVGGRRMVGGGMLGGFFACRTASVPGKVAR